MVDIIIPSCKDVNHIKMYGELLKLTYGKNCNVITTGLPSSASINRNYGLLLSERSDNEYVIMMDDDIGGFFFGWHEILINGLKNYSDVKLVSARLLNATGGLSPMMGCDYDLGKEYSIVTGAVLSACIAFRKKDVLNKVWFDEEFIGSGFEDTLFCHELKKLYVDCQFIVANNCPLIHYHEMKKQGGKYFEFNRNVFLKKCTDVKLNRAVQEMRAYCA